MSAPAPIAEGQTGIYPRRGPGGWHGMGRTAVDLFDPTRDPPALLRAGDRFPGPAIIEEVTTTIVIEPGWTAKLDASGSYLITRKRR